ATERRTGPDWAVVYQELREHWLPLPRGLDKALLSSLATCQCITAHHNLLSPVRRGWGKPDSPVPWPTRRVEKDIAHSICACPGFGTNCPSPRAMASILSSWLAGPRSSCLC